MNEVLSTVAVLLMLTINVYAIRWVKKTCTNLSASAAVFFVAFTVILSLAMAITHFYYTNQIGEWSFLSAGIWLVFTLILLASVPILSAIFAKSIINVWQGDYFPSIFIVVVTGYFFAAFLGVTPFSYHHIQLQVTDQFDQPVENAQIIFFVYRFPYGRTMVSAKTDERGRIDHKWFRGSTVSINEISHPEYEFARDNFSIRFHIKTDSSLEEVSSNQSDELATLQERLMVKAWKFYPNMEPIRLRDKVVEQKEEGGKISVRDLESYDHNLFLNGTTTPSLIQKSAKFSIHKKSKQFTLDLLSQWSVQHKSLIGDVVISVKFIDEGVDHEGKEKGIWKLSIKAIDGGVDNISEASVYAAPAQYQEEIIYSSNHPDRIEKEVHFVSRNGLVFGRLSLEFQPIRQPIGDELANIQVYYDVSPEGNRYIRDPSFSPDGSIYIGNRRKNRHKITFNDEYSSSSLDSYKEQRLIRLLWEQAAGYDEEMLLRLQKYPEVALWFFYVNEAGHTRIVEALFDALTPLLEAEKFDEAIFYELAGDKRLHRFIAKNPHLPYPLYVSLSRSKGFGIRLGVAENPQLSDEIAADIYSLNFGLLHKLALNPNLTPEFFSSRIDGFLSWKSTPLIVEALYENPNVSKALIKDFIQNNQGKPMANWKSIENTELREFYRVKNCKNKASVSLGEKRPLYCRSEAERAEDCQKKYAKKWRKMPFYCDLVPQSAVYTTFGRSSLKQTQTTEKILPEIYNQGWRGVNVYALAGNDALLGNNIFSLSRITESESSEILARDKISKIVEKEYLYPRYNYTSAVMDVDGDYAVLGMRFNVSKNPLRADLYERTGSAYVLRRHEGEWQLDKKLTASDANERFYFGVDVSISGAWLAVCALGTKDQTKPNILGYGTPRIGGGVYLFKLQKGVWEKHSKVAEGACHSISLQKDKLLVGLYDQKTIGGAVYAYKYEEEHWQYKQTLLASDYTPKGFDFIHYAKDIDISGDYVVLSNPMGAAAYIFKYGESGWQQMQKLQPISDENEVSGFSDSVAIKGEWLVVGAPRTSMYMDGEYFNDVGIVYRYRLKNNEWQLFDELTPSQPLANLFFGKNIDIDKNNVLIGLAYDGAHYIYLQSLFRDAKTTNPPPDRM